MPPSVHVRSTTARRRQGRPRLRKVLSATCGRAVRRFAAWQGARALRPWRPQTEAHRAGMQARQRHVVRHYVLRLPRCAAPGAGGRRARLESSPARTWRGRAAARSAARRGKSPGRLATRAHRHSSRTDAPDPQRPSSQYLVLPSPLCLSSRASGAKNKGIRSEWIFESSATSGIPASF